MLPQMEGEGDVTLIERILLLHELDGLRMDHEGLVRHLVDSQRIPRTGQIGVLNLALRFLESWRERKYANPCGTPGEKYPGMTVVHTAQQHFEREQCNEQPSYSVHQFYGFPWS